MNTMGEIIAVRRKELGMTQKELAAKMNVTDKAVSKWERGLASPDINSVPRLAEILEVSVVELMDAQEAPKQEEAPMKHVVKEMIDLVFKVVPLAMGIAVGVLSVMGKLDANSGFGMLGLGMFCLAMRNLPENN